ncbi:MAG TPA: DUF3108 domain-containing protein [Anaeromyxobacter sp.]|nr:DUF3108 domain-containing protein [Anaeromyxobacter sp.]
MNLVPLLLAATALLPPPYAPGERMRFRIDLMGMRMGTATIEVGDPGLFGVPIRLEAHTTGVANAVYSFRQELTSHLEPETGLPTRFVINQRERNWKHLDTTDYDREKGEAVLVERGKRVLTKRTPIPRDVVDFVALVFQLRRMPLEPGDRRTFSVLSGVQLRDVIVEVMKRETVKTRAGRFPALKIRVPTGFTGKFSEKKPTYLWLSDDPRRIVVKLTTDFSFGSAEGELMSYRAGGDAPADTARRD